jgi:hypothetical protein
MGDSNKQQSMDHHAQSPNDPKKTSPSLDTVLTENIQKSVKSLGIDLYNETVESRLFSRLLDMVRKLEFENLGLKEELEKLKKSPKDIGSKLPNISKPLRQSDAPWEIVRRVYIRQPFNFSRVDESNVEYYLEPLAAVEEAYPKADFKIEMRIGKLEDYFQRRPHLRFVVFKDYNSREYRNLQDEVALEPRIPFSIQPPLFINEQVSICSHSMEEAMNALSALMPEQLGQWWTSKKMDAPYLPIFHYHALIEQKMEEIDARYHPDIRLLLNFIRKRHASEYGQAESLFSEGLVSKEHLSKLFRPNDVLVTFQEDLCLGYVCNDWPNEAKSFFNDSKSRVELGCTYWTFNGVFFKKTRKFSIDWPRSDSSVMQIADLPVYPLRFADPSIKAHLGDRGRKFWVCRHRKYVAYHGPGHKSTTQNVR